jgi:ABC-type glycerol-3-phosphate transport system substrate-binding protein
MFKKIAVISVGLAFLIALAVPAFSAEKRDLTFWGFWAPEHAKPVLELIRRDFTPKAGIRVKYETLGYGAPLSKLLLAVMDKKVPDLVFSSPDWPIELYVRGAVVDLKKEFGAEYDALAKTMFPGSLEGYKFGNAQIAFAHNMWVPAMYYRKDVFRDNGWTAPATWNDLYELLGKMGSQKKGIIHQPGMMDNPSNIEWGVPAGYMPFLFQLGGDFYSADGLKAAVDNAEGIAAFKEFVEIYTKYKVPVSAKRDAVWRSGEAILAIDHDATTGGYRTVLAEQGKIDELGMTQIPGHMRGGKIDRTGYIYAWTQYMMSGSKAKKEAWEFFKWYYSTPTQLAISRGFIEMWKGTTWKMANMEAAKQYTAEANPQFAETLFNTLAISRQIRPVLGGLITPRFIADAFQGVIEKGMTPEAAIRNAADEMNKEMKAKQEEFAEFVNK